MTDFTTNYNVPLPGATAASRRLADIQSVRAAIIAIDAAILSAIGIAGPGGLTETEINALIATQINTLKDGVAVEGDTLAKLYGLYNGLNGTVSTLTTTVNGKLNTNLGNVAGGFPILNGSGKIDPNQLPSYVDDILEFPNEAALPPTGEAGKLYVTVNDDKIFRWSGSVYVNIVSNGVNSVNGRSGIVILNKVDVALGNVDNTSDINKPVSTAQNTAINSSASSTLTLAATDASTKASAAQAAAIAASTPSSHAGASGAAHPAATTSIAGFMSAADKLKLDSINAVGGGNADTATALQTPRTINGVAFDGTANITINAVDTTARIASSEKGVVNGVATLDDTGRVPAVQLPSYVDDVLEFANVAAFPGTGESGKIYIALDTNLTYRWSGSVYTAIVSGAVTSVAGKTGAVSLTQNDVAGLTTTSTPTFGSITSTGNIVATGTITSGGVEVGAKLLTQNSRSADYVLVAADEKRHVFHPSSDTSTRTFTIPSNASVPFEVGTALTFVVQNGAGNINIAINNDILRNSNGATGTRVLTANGMATALKIAATEWLILGTNLT